MSMSSRERVLCALNHEEPDRVPLFIGTSGATNERFSLVTASAFNLPAFTGGKAVVMFSKDSCTVPASRSRRGRRGSRARPGPLRPAPGAAERRTG